MKYFTLTELSRSDTAKALKINNTIPDNLKLNALDLIDKLLDPLRVAWGSGIKVNSGYRCDKLNEAVGGSKTSSHSYALASDIEPINGKINEFAIFVRNWLKINNIQFDQYIEEHGSKNNPNAFWIHLSLKNSKGQLRKEYLLYKDKKYSKLNF